MVTTAAHTDTLHDIEFKPRLSPWASFVKRLKARVASFVERHEMLCCCFGSEDFQMVREDNRRRKLIRESMRVRLGIERVDDPITGVIDDVFLTTRYNLGGRKTVVKRVGKDTPMSQTDWDDYNAAYTQVNKTVKFVPRFAGVMALVIRTRLGKMRPNEANILLVRREYNRLARERGVRPQDTVAHEQYVVNAVFTELLFDEIATSRPRLPRWALWLTNSSATAHSEGVY